MQKSKPLYFAAGGVALLLLVGVLAWTVWTLSAGNSDANELLQLASKQQTIVSTYQIDTHIGHSARTAGDPARYESTIVAFVVEGEGTYIAGDTPGGRMEFLLYRDKQYRRESNSGPWTELNHGTTGFVLPTLNSAKHSNVVDELEDAKILGDETLDGVLTSKVIGYRDQEDKADSIWGDYDDLDEEQRAGIDAPRNQMIAGSERYTLWVAKDTGLIHKYTANGTYPAEGHLLAYTTWETVQFSDFNGEITIPDPEDLEIADGDESDNSSETPAPTVAPTPTSTPEPDRE